jgi:hypothetical protein
MLLIPRRFHRIWLGNRPLPKEFVEFGRSWQALHPGWTLHTWTDASLCGMTNTEAFQRSRVHSGKANVLRYEILLHHGGVYIDTDFECKKNIEPLLDGVPCFVGEQSPGFANNAIVGAVPVHPFLRELVAGLSKRVPHFSRLPSIKQSGPYYLNEILRGRNDVTRFPPELFYPYQWHERWRRNEGFPHAYGVHHWALSWKKKRPVRPCNTHPDLSVLLINLVPDVQRLRWTLEGLCEQVAPAAFEVVVMDYSRDSCIRDAVATFSNRLKLFYVLPSEYQRGLLSNEVKHYASHCRAPRVLLLDSRCVPTRKVVREHSRFNGTGVVAYSSQRLYPGHKFFPFCPPLDYDAMKFHSIPDSRYHMAGDCAAKSDWKDIPESCISVPRSSFAEVAIPLGMAMREGGRWFARELMLRGHEISSTPAEACVTRLAN